mgnify:CR=1 FL=1
MTYENILGILKSNHFNPTRKTKDGKIIEIHVECPATILMDSKKARLEEILKEAAVDATVQAMSNEGYLLIKKIK